MIGLNTESGCLQTYLQGIKVVYLITSTFAIMQSNWAARAGNTARNPITANNYRRTNWSGQCVHNCEELGDTQLWGAALPMWRMLLIRCFWVEFWFPFVAGPTMQLSNCSQN